MLDCLNKILKMVCYSYLRLLLFWRKFNSRFYYHLIYIKILIKTSMILIVYKKPTKNLKYFWIYLKYKVNLLDKWYKNCIILKRIFFFINSLNISNRFWWFLTYFERWNICCKTELNCVFNFKLNKNLTNNNFLFVFLLNNQVNSFKS